MRCSVCGSEVATAARFCGSCGHATGRSLDSGAAGTAHDAETMAAGSLRPGAGATGPIGPSRSSSSDSVRFIPGQMLGDRYRVERRLGRGGMGEVYLAEDLKLAQPVALKFLPQALELDPERLSQLQGEVKVARQVSHANVCRVYDLADAGGVHFITMEFVDGEDLASLQRRIGRLPEDRAIEVARQLAAGVAAAHARGVLHRDLKPANVMIDAVGRVQITDFGLAVAGATVGASVAGTPAYMAPEQLGGAPASEKSDIFAVGLILYELFTGRPAFEARTIDELRELHHARSSVSPAERVPGLHPAVDRVIMRCLDPEPERRPASALAIAAELPGGDPLAAALAAGETPSPELVAASGGEAATIRPLIGVAWLAGALAMVVVVGGLVDRFGMIARVPLPLSWDALADRARSFEARLGLGRDATAHATGLVTDLDAIAWIQARPDAVERAGLFAAARPPALRFWHRSSPRGLVPGNPSRLRPTLSDPPVDLSGMTAMSLDTTGRLVGFDAVTSQIESAMPSPGPPVDWTLFFDAAGLEVRRFDAIEPDWTPSTFADARMAWASRDAEAGLRVEAASHRGVPVSFQVIGPWTRPTRMRPQASNRATALVATVAAAVVVPACLLGGLLLARRNLARGRGDRLGAVRLAVLAFGLSLVRWALGAEHYADVGAEQARLAAALSSALVAAGLYGLLYLAIEPQVRRLRPVMLVTWSRLVSGRYRDPLFGRDLLFGAVTGLAMTLITLGHYQLPSWFGWAEFTPPISDASVLRGTAGFLAAAVGALDLAVQNALLGGVGIILLRLVTPSFAGAFAIGAAVFSFLAAQGQIVTGTLWLDVFIGMLLVLPVLGVIVRYGFVAGIVTFAVHFLTKNVPMSLDPGRPYFADGLLIVGVVMSIAIAGFVLARAREPLFGGLVKVD